MSFYKLVEYVLDRYYDKTDTLVTLYYISRKGQDFADRVRVGIKFKKFKKISDLYFRDCPDLISKIESKYFKREDHEGVEDLVIYYNENCVN